MTDEKLKQQDAPAEGKTGEATMSITIKPAALQVPGKPQKLDVSVSIPQDVGMAVVLLRKLQDAVMEVAMEDARTLGIQQGLQMQADQRMVKTPDEVGLGLGITGRPSDKIRLT